MTVIFKKFNKNNKKRSRYTLHKNFAIITCYINVYK